MMNMDHRRKFLGCHTGPIPIPLVKLHVSFYGLSSFTITSTLMLLNNIATYTTVSYIDNEVQAVDYDIQLVL